LRAGGEHVQRLPHIADLGLQLVAVTALSDAVRLMAGFLHRTGLEPNRRRQRLPAEPDIDK
jgi:hypothetical protein